MNRFAKAAAAAMVAGAVTSSTAGSDDKGDVNFQLGAYRSERVYFQSHGVPIVGLLYTPQDMSKKRPAVVILGPFGAIKEQSPMEYATRLARDGFITLVFDPRYTGESGGGPRRLESPKAKIEDVEAALDFLQTRPQVDSKRLAALGICQGSSEMIAMTASDARIQVLVTVSGQYIYPKNIDGFFGNGGLTREQRIERGKAAKARYDTTGEVDYTEVVSPTDKNAGLPWRPIYDWYHPWTTDKWLKPSRWENRYATMSDAEVWSFNVDDYASKVTVPTLIIHGEMSDGNVEAAQHVYTQIGAKDKRLTIVPGIFHTRFYDDPSVIDPVAAEASRWFAEHLR
jgi:uncharacterized protein